MNKLSERYKSKEKKENAITLIALVITIIVLLILAGITISTLTGDNGILTKATEARTQAEIADEREKVELSANGALAKDNGGEITEENLEEELTSYIGTRDKDYELTGTGPFIVKYLDSGRSYKIDEDGIVKKYEDTDEDTELEVKVGDYVNYTPSSVETSYAYFGEKYTSCTNAEIGQEDLKWRVLNINSDGTIDLISESPTSAIVYLQNARGYNNGVYVLNDYCEEMYSNSLIGAVARSLNIEDIQDKMITYDEGKKGYEYYTTSTTGVLYGNTYSYSTNKYYPLQWLNDNGATGESQKNSLTEYESDDDAKTIATDNLEVKQTYWWGDADVMYENFISADTRDSSDKDTIYYELLCNNGNLTYWLASRCVDTDNTSYASFGIRYVYEGGVYGIGLMYSNGNEGSGSSRHYGYAIRPVVTLKADSINIDEGYDSTNGWSLTS